MQGESNTNFIVNNQQTTGILTSRYAFLISSPDDFVFQATEDRPFHLDFVDYLMSTVPFPWHFLSNTFCSFALPFNLMQLLFTSGDDTTNVEVERTHSSSVFVHPLTTASLLFLEYRCVPRLSLVHLMQGAVSHSRKPCICPHISPM